MTSRLLKETINFFRNIKKVAKAHISKGNQKIGGIYNVSLIPVFTCKHCECCNKDCYALKSLMYANVRTAWAENTWLAINEPKRFFDEISAACKMQRYFRWHVAGDILDLEYFKGMIKVAKDNKHCEFLAFTKAYEFINEYKDQGGKIPKNLHIIFSDFETFHCENPYNFPVTDVINSADELPKGGKLCGGNCTDCICRGVGCWELKKGEKLYFIKH